MIGLFALALTAVMIYTLIKNALVGTQLSNDDSFHGSIDLIIPITFRSEFFIEPWLQNLGSLDSNIKIHVLIDGHHPTISAWNELHEKLPGVQIHTFVTRPLGKESVPWMIEQVSAKINSDIVIIGDAELVPTKSAFSSLGKLVSEKQKAYFVLPQTAKHNLFGEAIAVLNPTLALASIFGFRKIRRNVSHPLVGIAQGWMGMPLSMFRQFDWSKINIASWKEALSKGWDVENKTYILAFGEKHLLRYYPEDLKTQIFRMKSYWEELWLKGDRTGLWLFLSAIFIWSFPILCFLTHPYWSIASIMLLILYRFFTKIVFQESWSALALHFFGSFVWLGTFIWWGIDGLKARYGTKRPV